MTHSTITKVAVYCRVSTADQNADRQERDLREFASRRGYEVVAVFTETASGAKNDRAERSKIIQMARAKKIDAILCTELSRWGRSTPDVLSTMQQLAGWGVSLVAQSGLDFDLTSPSGKLMLTILAGVSEFERDLLRERTISGLQAARAKGKQLGRQVGQNPSDKYAAEVLQHLQDGRSVRWIAHELQIAPGTIQAIKKRNAVAS